MMKWAKLKSQAAVASVLLSAGCAMDPIVWAAANRRPTKTADQAPSTAAQAPAPVGDSLLAGPRTRQDRRHPAGEAEGDLVVPEGKVNE